MPGHEADDINATLARRNFAANSVAVDLVQAAVGAEDGVAAFAESSNSLYGRLDERGAPVPTLTIESILARVPPQRRIDLLKIDIEGGEQHVFRGDCRWLDRVDAIVGEFHSASIDVAALHGLLDAHGFDRVSLSRIDYVIRAELSRQLALVFVGLAYQKQSIVA